jgi:hypothetical protein
VENVIERPQHCQWTSHPTSDRIYTPKKILRLVWVHHNPHCTYVAFFGGIDIAPTLTLAFQMDDKFDFNMSAWNCSFLGLNWESRGNELYLAKVLISHDQFAYRVLYRPPIMGCKSEIGPLPHYKRLSHANKCHLNDLVF